MSEPERPAYKDDASSGDVPSMMVSGYALGATSLERLAVISSENGIVLPTGSFKEAVHFLWATDQKAAFLVCLLLAADERVHMRADLAVAMPQYHKAIFRILSADFALSVRAAIAANVITPADMLLHLASDKDELVRFAVASTERAGKSALSLLCEDHSPVVKTRANATLALLEKKKDM